MHDAAWRLLGMPAAASFCFPAADLTAGAEVQWEAHHEDRHGEHTYPSHAVQTPHRPRAGPGDSLCLPTVLSLQRCLDSSAVPVEKCSAQSVASPASTYANQASSESESGYISSSHIRLIRCLAVIGQASFTREHLV